MDQGGYGPWRPFSTGLRTRKLVEYLKEIFSDRITEFEEKYIEF